MEFNRIDYSYVEWDRVVMLSENYYKIMVMLSEKNEKR